MSRKATRLLVRMRLKIAIVVMTGLVACVSPAFGQLVFTIRSVEVTTLSDDPSPAGCSLREAIESIDLAADLGGCVRSTVVGRGQDRVTFDPTLVPGEIRLNEPLRVFSSLAIRGPGRDLLSITAQNSHEILVGVIDPDEGGVTIQDVTLTEGRSGMFTGAVHADRVNLSGVRISFSGAVQQGLDATFSSGALSGATLSIVDSEFIGNRVTAPFGYGAAMTGVDVSIRSSVFVDNESSAFGGAIASNGELSISDTTFQENRAATGGAIYFSGRTGMIETSRFIDNDGEGAVVFQERPTAGRPNTLTIARSVIVDQLNSPSGISLFGQLNELNDGDTATLTLENVSVLAQRTIRVQDTLNLTHATIRIEGAGAPPAVVLSARSEGFFSSSIFESANPETCRNEGGTMTGDHNIYRNTGCAANEVNTILGDPLLGPLQDNGGPTESIAPLPGSPAIDNSNLTTLAVDQRGFPRTVGSTDIGAVEFGAGLVFSDGFE